MQVADGWHSGGGARAGGGAGAGQMNMNMNSQTVTEASVVGGLGPAQCATSVQEWL